MLTNSFGAASEMVDGGASGVIVEVEDALCQLPQILIQLAHDSARLDALSKHSNIAQPRFGSAGSRYFLSIAKCYSEIKVILSGCG